jgi:hypothetical protein
MLKSSFIFILKNAMKLTTTRYLLGLLLLCSFNIQASDFEAALSSETAQFTFRSDSSLIGWGGSELGIGFFYNEADDFATQFSLMQRRQPSKQNPLTLGVGVRGYLGQLDILDESIVAIAIGGEIRYTIPGAMPMSFYLIGHYAPSITSFADAEELLDYNLGFQIEILPQTTAFVGYRSLEVDLDESGDYEYEMTDDRVHLGIRLTF